MSTTTAVSPELVKQLRDKTSAGMMDCKKALVEAKGDLEAAEVILRKKGMSAGTKKAGREAKEGVIASYIHFDKVGVLVEINCETDFVARNESFRAFVKDVTLQIAAGSPSYVSRDEVPESFLAKEREIAAEQVKGKPANIVDKIVSGKLDKIFATNCLLEQAFVKDDKQTIKDLVNAKIAELGENIIIRRFVRFAVGETTTAPAAPAAS
ncbi:MAG: translation elongation factor Ts [Candidatus Methylacidiphilales bacterium]|nr:translation elongation factor Ts [Candidatus Methylacidiphilales bacterium]